jgi:lipid-binding SYLF domain-containing protein
MLPFTHLAGNLVGVRIAEAERLFEAQQSFPGGEIPARKLQGAKALLLVKNSKGGGYALLLARNPESHQWGEPVFLKAGSDRGEVGLQVGGRTVDVIYLIMTQEALDLALETSFQIGVNSTARIGSRLDKEKELLSAILAYTQERGLMGGALVEGSLLFSDEESNESAYGKRYTSQDLLLRQQGVQRMTGVQRLIDAINRHSDGKQRD